MEVSNNGSLTECENCTGYCSRHKIQKNPNWVRLCQTKQAYFDAWDAGTGPGQERDSVKAKERVDAHEKRIALYHALWLELHTIENPTPEWFSGWVRRVPNFGCKCRSWLVEYLKKNPPRYDDFPAWSVELHNAVNIKVGNPIWSPST